MNNTLGRTIKILHYHWYFYNFINSTNCILLTLLSVIVSYSYFSAVRRRAGAGAPAYFDGAGVCSAPAKLWQHLTASYWLDRSFLFIHAYTVSRRCLMGNDRYVFSSQQSPYTVFVFFSRSFRFIMQTWQKPDEVRHDSLWTILMTLKSLPLSRTLNIRHIIWRCALLPGNNR